MQRPLIKQKPREASNKFLRTMGDEINQMLRRRESEQQKAEFNSKLKNKLRPLRMQLVQNYNKANELNPQDLVQNTEAFIKDTTTFMSKEFKLLSKVYKFDCKQLDVFVKYYKIHVLNLVKNEEQLNSQNYDVTNRFITEVNSYLPVLQTRFMSLVMDQEKMLEKLTIGD